MAGGMAIKVILKPILGLMDTRDAHSSELEIEKTLTLNPRTLVKDLCKSVMEGYNSGHVNDDFRVLACHSNFEFCPFRTFFHDTNAPIGSVAVLFEGMLTIKILIPLNLFYDCDCNPNTMTPDVVYEEFIKYMISRLGNNNSQVPDPIIQYVKNEMEGRSFKQLPSETLSIMDRELTHARQWNITSMSRSASQSPKRSISFASDPRDSSTSSGGVGSDVFQECIAVLDSIIDGVSGTTSSQKSHKEIQQGGRAKEGVIYDKEIELPMHELLYSRSHAHDFGRYACELNVLSGRTGSDKLTAGNICS
uniref:Non-specific serine/threonine protein kinase n=1 Tax=Strongyloides papillosus TaxID=174720 RepID=A0A0N5C139_STREA